MFVGPVLLVLAAMQPAVVVEGRGDCPAAADVQRRLGELMAAVPDGVSQDRARLAVAGDELEVHLVREDGANIAKRLLPARGQGSCADLASAAAVVIATWEAQLRPQRLGRDALAGALRSKAPEPRAEAPVRATPARRRRWRDRRARG